MQLGGLKDQVKFELINLKKTKEKFLDTEEAQQIIQKFSQKVQEKTHKQISSIVSKCLQTIFPDPYQFRIDFRKSRGKTKAVPVFSRDGLDIENPIQSIGGAVVEVAALALRVACLILSQPKKRLILILDEPFRMVHRSYKSNIKNLLTLLSKELGIQIIFITQDSDLEMGQIVHIT